MEDAALTINETNKVLAFKKLMLDSMLNFRFRGATLKHEELPIALRKFFIDKASSPASQTFEGRHKCSNRNPNGRQG